MKTLRYPRDLKQLDFNLVPNVKYWLSYPPLFRDLLLLMYTLYVTAWDRCVFNLADISYNQASTATWRRHK